MSNRVLRRPKLDMSNLIDSIVDIFTYLIERITVEPRYFEVPREMEKSSK